MNYELEKRPRRTKDQRRNKGFCYQIRLYG